MNPETNRELEQAYAVTNERIMWLARSFQTLSTKTEEITQPELMETVNSVQQYILEQMNVFDRIADKARQERLNHSWKVLWVALGVLGGCYLMFSAFSQIQKMEPSQPRAIQQQPITPEQYQKHFGGQHQ